MDQKFVEIKFHDLRKWAIDKRGSVDDKPYGGGHGMILRCEPVVNATRDIKKEIGVEGKDGIEGKSMIVIFDARGETFNQQKAFEFAKLDHLILICGHYEGFDERILNFVDMSLSIGDFVLTGGEIPALAVTDAVTRLLLGVLKEGVVENESFSLKGEKRKSLEYPQYTRPEVFEGHKVPEVLLSGNHEEVEKWRESANLILK